MARKSRSKSRSNRTQRDISKSIATRPRVLHVRRSPVVAINLPGPTSSNRSAFPVPDARFWHPEARRQNRPIPAVTRPALKLVARPRMVRKGAQRGAFIRVGFADPKRVLTCVRRHARRQVLHALKRLGGGAGKPRRFNSNSFVRC